MAVKATVDIVEFGQHTADTYQLKLTIATHDTNYTGDPEYFITNIPGSQTAAGLKALIQSEIQTMMENHGVTFGGGDTVQLLRAFDLS